MPSTDGQLNRTTRKELRELIEFATASKVSEGFGYLDRFGTVDHDRETSCFMTARMTYAFSVAALLGEPNANRLAAHGIDCLSGPFWDQTHGGYFASLGEPHSLQRKGAYETCFVALAAASAATAGISGADELVIQVSLTLETRFWSEDNGALVESWDRKFIESELYWGANVNMHGLEAMLALYGYTRKIEWRDRALQIAETFIKVRARSSNWWLNEHYAHDWQPLPDFNIDDPRDEFRPYGMTIGHLFEWSRLLLQLESTFSLAPVWLREAAAGLYETAVKYGWDGNGFVYTVDWNGKPVIQDRPHWVVTEAISAAATWSNLTGNPIYAEQLQAWTAHARKYFVDSVHGSWHHLLTSDNEPSYTIWSGKPDIYHILQAVLLPTLPVAESTVRATMGAKNISG